MDYVTIGVGGVAFTAAAVAWATMKWRRPACSQCAERAAVDVMLGKQKFVVTGGVSYCRSNSADKSKLYKIEMRDGRVVTALLNNTDLNTFRDADTGMMLKIEEVLHHANAFWAFYRRRALTPWWRRRWVR